MVHLIVALHSLGKAEILTPLARITPAQGRAFAASLYLLLERAKPVARTILAELLWPGIEDEPRQHRLRQVLLELRQAGVPLETNRGTIALAGVQHTSDLDVLLGQGAAEIDSIPSLQFLPGYAPTFSRDYSDWLDSKRREAVAGASRLLINDIRRARGRGDWMRVERLAAMCLEIDPFNEEGVLAGAEASAMRGAKREAVSMLDRYVADLGPGSGDLKLPANLMRKRIAERVPEATMAGRTEGIFVGREADMQLLTTLLDDARGSEGRCCLLFGDPGIGKSRLAAELGRFSELQGVQVRRVACRRGDTQRPLSVFVDAVPQLLDMRGALGCSPDTIADLRRLIQFDTGRDAKQAMEVDPQSMFELIRLAIFDLIDAVSDEQCLMLVIEDVHWMDAASARILGQLADWSAKKRVFLLFTSRLRVNPLLDACTRAGLVAHHIRPLSENAAIALVSEMFEATNEKRDEEFFEWCRKVGDGNPFFLHELVKQWLETKQRHVIPPSLMTVIRERFSRLGSEGTQLLQACSILGEQSTLPRVEKILQQEPYKLLGALGELSKASMMSPERKITLASGDFHLRPRHDMVSTVALQELDPHATAFLHRRAAEVLESELSGEVQDTGLLWACAQHWQKAGEPGRGYHLGRRYAESLVEVGLPGDAADALLRLLEFCPTVAEEVRTLGLAVPALESAYRWAEVKRTIAQIRSRHPSDSVHDDFELAEQYSQWRLGDHKTSLNSSLTCLRDSNAPSSHRIHAGNIAMRVASNIAAVSQMREIMSIADTVEPITQIDEFALEELRTIFHTSCGDLALGVVSVDRLAATCCKSGNPVLIFTHATNCATMLRLLGQVTRARELLTEARDALIARRCYHRAKYASLQIVRLDLLERDPVRARENFDSVACEFPPDDMLSRIEQQYLYARLLLAEGNLAEAKNVISPLIANKDNTPSVFLGRILATAVSLALAGGTVDWSADEVMASLEEVHLTERGDGWNDFEAEALFLGLIAGGRRKRAITLAKDYVKKFRRDLSPIPTGIATLLGIAGTEDVPKQLR